MVGEDRAKIHELLEDYIDALPPEGARSGEEHAGAVERALIALEEQFRDLLRGGELSAERIDTLAARLREHLATLAADPDAVAAVPGAPATPGDTDPQRAPATLTEDRRVVSLDSALAVRGYCAEDVARFRALAEEMKALVGPGIKDTQVLLAEFLEQTGDLPAVDTGTEQGGDEGAVDEVLARLEDRFLSYLGRRGLDEETIRRIGDTLAHRLAQLLVNPGATPVPPPPAPPAKARTPKLDREVMRPRETRRQIELEIARCARYGCAFSCVSIAASSITAGTERREPEESDMVLFTNAVLKRLRTTLRTPDRIGTIGSVAKNHIVVLLPMSDEGAAAVARERFGQTLEGLSVEIAGEDVGVETVTSISSFAGSRPIRTGSFVRRLRADLKAALSGGVS